MLFRSPEVVKSKVKDNKLEKQYMRSKENMVFTKYKPILHMTSCSKLENTKATESSLGKLLAKIETPIGSSDKKKSDYRISDLTNVSLSPGNLSGKSNSKGNKIQGSNQANVKGVARLRPLNKKEHEFISQGVGCACCNVIEEKTISFPDENFTVALDHVFDKESTQVKIYDKVGKATVEDVLNGYNGTILAYGQTGTGKTHTMFGPNIYDDDKKGIIPSEP